MNKFYGNGRKSDILITILPRKDTTANFMMGETEHTYEFDRLRVWADAGLQTAFARVEGIMQVVVPAPSVPVQYVLLVDPRYDTEWVIKEVEAVAKTFKGTENKPELSSGGYNFRFLGAANVGRLRGDSDDPSHT